MNIRALTDRFRLISGGYVALDFSQYEIFSAFQPIYSINQGRGTLYGVEALARPERDGVPVDPVTFFAGLSSADAFAADWACMMLHLVNASAWNLENTSLFVNLNPSSCQQTGAMLKGLDAYVAHARSIGLSPRQIVCEFTEQALVDPSCLREVSQKLKSLGCRVAMDDFGVEGSDMDRVQDINPDLVKIDPSWFRAMMLTEGSRTEIHKILKRIRASGADILFEGVETPQDLLWVRECGGHLIQGWLFGKATNASGSRDHGKPSRRRSFLQETMAGRAS